MLLLPQETLRIFNLRSLSKIPLDVEQVASFVGVRIMMFRLFAKGWMYMMIEVIRSSSGEFYNSKVLMFW